MKMKCLSPPLKVQAQPRYFWCSEKDINMVVSRFELEGMEPMSFLKNRREQAKVLMLKLKTKEMEIIVPKIDYQASCLPQLSKG